MRFFSSPVGIDSCVRAGSFGTIGLAYTKAIGSVGSGAFSARSTASLTSAVTSSSIRVSSASSRRRLSTRYCLRMPIGSRLSHISTSAADRYNLSSSSEVWA